MARAARLPSLVCCLFVLVASAPAQEPPCGPDDLVVSGKLVHDRWSDDLFRVDRLWMRVPSGTVFHRWLSDAGGVAVWLTVDPSRFGDTPTFRILSGTIQHGVAPRESSLVHMIFVSDEVSGSVGPIAFQTTDLALVLRFDACPGVPVRIVIEKLSSRRR